MSKVRSLVWQFFTGAENTDGTAKCDTCREVVKRLFGNTSNLAGHLNGIIRLNISSSCDASKSERKFLLRRYSIHVLRRPFLAGTANESRRMDGRNDDVCCFDHRGVIFLDVYSTHRLNSTEESIDFRQA